uniref:Uncharacterized protein n=1 Tax=Arundo donax TaxID=35708 RepID=A0A0A9F991_ARUDO
MSTEMHNYNIWQIDNASVDSLLISSSIPKGNTNSLT